MRSLVAQRKNNLKLPNCPIETTLLFLGDRMKILIIGYLMQESLRPSQLKNRIGGISKRLLYNKLKELEVQGVIEQNVIREVGHKVEYSLTELGRSFYEVIFTMKEWGEQYKAS